MQLAHNLLQFTDLRASSAHGHGSEPPAPRALSTKEDLRAIFDDPQRTHVVRFFSDHCGHCRSSQETWASAVADLAAHGIVCHESDCTAAGAIAMTEAAKAVDVYSVPTLLRVHAHRGLFYDGSPREVGSIHEFARTGAHSDATKDVILPARARS